MVIKKRGFTIIEMTLVVAILSILILLAVPSFKSSANYMHKNSTNTIHKVLANAIEYWSKDNINPIQKPANFNSINSQGHTVIEYLSNKDIIKDTNLKIEKKEVTINERGDKKTVQYTTVDSSATGVVDVIFEDGVLHTIFINDDGTHNDDISVVFKVFDDLEYDKASNKVTGQKTLKEKNMLLYDIYKEFTYSNPDKVEEW